MFDFNNFYSFKGFLSAFSNRKETLYFSCLMRFEILKQFLPVLKKLMPALRVCSKQAKRKERVSILVCSCVIKHIVYGDLILA